MYYFWFLKASAKKSNISNELYMSDESDDVFENINPFRFNVIFIDGMHHCENVLRDFNNSIKALTKNCHIFIYDCICD